MEKMEPLQIMGFFLHPVQSWLTSQTLGPAQGEGGERRGENEWLGGRKHWEKLNLALSQTYGITALGTCLHKQDILFCVSLVVVRTFVQLHCELDREES